MSEAPKPVAPPPTPKPAVPRPTTALGGLPDCEFSQLRRGHISSTAQGFMNTANTIADVAVGFTNVGSAYEAIMGKTITGQELTTFQRGVAGVSVAFAPLAFVARIGGNAVADVAQGVNAHNRAVDTTGVVRAIPTNAADVQNILAGLTKGKQDHVVTVKSDAELKALFAQMTQGGTPVTLPARYTDGVGGVKLPDGTEIWMRLTSKSGGAAIDIKLPKGVKGPINKVHIE